MPDAARRTDTCWHAWARSNGFWMHSLFTTIPLIHFKSQLLRSISDLFILQTFRPGIIRSFSFCIFSIWCPHVRTCFINHNYHMCASHAQQVKKNELFCSGLNVCLRIFYVWIWHIGICVVATELVENDKLFQYMPNTNVSETRWFSKQNYFKLHIISCSFG